MEEYTIYALKADANALKEHNIDITQSLLSGEGRFGWSFIDNADLNILKQRINANGWNSLSKEEQACYQSFLLELKSGDYVVYINMPSQGKCTSARVTGQYFWKKEKEDDFNHRFPVDPKSVIVFDRNDAIVTPALSARLKLQGRYWRVYAKNDFEILLKQYSEGKPGNARTLQTNRNLLSEKILQDLENITKLIQETHPNYDLEGFLAEVFKNVPGIKEVHLNGGAGDHGADIILIFEALPFLNEQRMCVVQVKSFINEHSDITAVNDIRRAFDFYKEATSGLIISTAARRSAAFDQAIEKLQDELAAEKSNKSVSLMIGADVATFVLRYAGNLLQKIELG